MAILHDPVDSGDDLRHVHGPGIVGDLDAHDACVRRDADEIVGTRIEWVSSRCTTSDDAGHVGSVSKCVESDHFLERRLEREIRADEDIAARQLGHRCDAGVDDSDVDSRSGEAGGPHVVRSDLADHIGQQRRDIVDVRDLGCHLGGDDRDLVVVGDDEGIVGCDHDRVVATDDHDRVDSVVVARDDDRVVGGRGRTLGFGVFRPIGLRGFSFAGVCRGCASGCETEREEDRDRHRPAA